MFSLKFCADVFGVDCCVLLLSLYVSRVGPLRHRVCVWCHRGLHLRGTRGHSGVWGVCREGLRAVPALASSRLPCLDITSPAGRVGATINVGWERSKLCRCLPRCGSSLAGRVTILAPAPASRQVAGSPDSEESLDAAWWCSLDSRWVDTILFLRKPRCVLAVCSPGLP